MTESPRLLYSCIHCGRISDTPVERKTLKPHSKKKIPVCPLCGRPTPKKEP